MYKYKNANPMGNDIDDCTVRAISIAEGISWDEAYENLSNSARRLGLMMSSVPAIDYYLDIRYKRINTDDYTVGDFINKHPNGTYLITMPRTYNSLKKSELIMILLIQRIENCGVYGKSNNGFPIFFR